MQMMYIFYYIMQTSTNILHCAILSVPFPRLQLASIVF